MTRILLCLIGAAVVVAMALPGVPPPIHAGNPDHPHLTVDKGLSANLTCVGREVRITLNVTGAGEPVEERLPVDVMLIIDRSGSMAWPSDEDDPEGPTRLDKAKEAALAFVDFLEDNPPPDGYDRVGLVSYSGDGVVKNVYYGDTTLDVPLTDGFDEVRVAIGDLTARGSTCIACGLEHGNDEFDEKGRDGVVWAQVMLTDGIPNRPHGDGTDVFNEDDAQLSRDKAHTFRNMGGTLHTIGLGGHDEISHYFLDDLPASAHTYNPADRAGHPYDGPGQDGLAYIGGGSYYYAPTGNQLQLVFEEVVKKITEVAGKDVVVTEVLPAGVSYVDGSAEPPPASIVGQTLTWNLGTISIGDTKTITFDVTFSEPGYQLANIFHEPPAEGARVTYTDYQSDPGQEVAFPETHIRVLQPVADAGNDVTIATGQSATLDGSESEILGGCEEAGGHIEFQWSVKDGEVEQAWSTDPTVTVSPTEATTYVLEVRCSALPDCTDSDEVTVTVGDVDFSDDSENRKEVDEEEAEPGDTLTFTIFYKNTGTMNATNVTITDEIDANLENVVPDDAGDYDPDTHTITWNIGTVAAGEGGSVYFTARIVSPLPHGTVIENVATIDSDQTDPVDTEPTTTMVISEPAPATLALTPPSATNVLPGDTGHVFTVTVEDQFDSPMAGQVVSLSTTFGTLSVAQVTTGPAGTATFSITSATPGTATITATLGDLTATATKTWTLEDPAAANLEVKPDLAVNVLPDDESHEFTVKVTDQFGSPMAGQVVSLSTTFGTLSVTQVTTGPAGTATFSITSATPGTATITATMGDLTATATKTWTLEDPVPYWLELVPPTGSNLVNTTHNITATVRDQFENVMQGVNLSWNITGPGSFVSQQTATGVNGTAHAVITSNVAGTSTVTCVLVEHPGISANVTKIWTTAPAPPLPPRPRPGPPPPAPEIRYLTVDWDEEITTERINTRDRLMADLFGPSPDARHSLLLEQGTRAPEVDGERHYLIVIRELDPFGDEMPPLPDDTVPVIAFNITPAGAVFDREIFLTLGFDELPEDVEEPIVAYYDDVEGVWVLLDSEPVDPNGVAELNLGAELTHFTIFAVLADIVPPPASFVGSDLDISRQVRKTWEPVTFVTRTGESVTISARITNDGGQTGTYTARLTLNGEAVDTTTVTLNPGQSQTVIFTLSDMEYGDYEVEVAGLSGEFATTRTIHWWLIVAIVAGIGLITWLIVWRRRRKKAAQQT